MKLTYILLIFLSISIKFTSAQVKLLTLDQLDNRIAKGKDTVYIVNFWATWCGPCVEELPHFEKLNQIYQSKPLKIILLSTDFKSRLEKVVNPFVIKHNLKSEVFLLDEKSEQLYINRVSKIWTGSLPATLVINPQKMKRNFYEREFSYDELEKVYLENKN